MDTRATLYPAIAWLMLGASIASHPCNSDTQRIKTGLLDEGVRIAHVRELLGNRKVKTIEKIGSEQVVEYVYSQVKHSLKNPSAGLAKDVAETILAESERYGFDPLFLMAVISHESRFNPVQLGRHGEIGLMQIKPSTAEWIAKKYRLRWTGAHSLRNPMNNIQIGAAFLSYLRARYESHGRLYLSAYNMGSANLSDALKRNVLPEQYANRVLREYVHLYSGLI